MATQICSNSTFQDRIHKKCGGVKLIVGSLCFGADFLRDWWQLFQEALREVSGADVQLEWLIACDACDKCKHMIARRHSGESESLRVYI